MVVKEGWLSVALHWRQDNIDVLNISWEKVYVILLPKTLALYHNEVNIQPIPSYIWPLSALDCSPEPNEILTILLPKTGNKEGKQLGSLELQPKHSKEREEWRYMLYNAICDISSPYSMSVWKKTAWEESRENCIKCNVQFSILVRQHHCRQCGFIFCDDCSISRARAYGYGDEYVRVCDWCISLEKKKTNIGIIHKEKQPHLLSNPYLEEIIQEDDLLHELNRVLELYEDAKMISSYWLLQRINNTLHKLSSISEDIIEFKKKHKDKLQLITTRGKIIIESLPSFDDNDASWTFAHSYNGVSTYTKLHDDGQTSVKIDGKLKTNAVHAMAVFREADLYKLWVPLMSNSQKLYDVSLTESLSYFKLSVPLFHRDAVVHVYGVDASEEADCIVFLGESNENIQAISSSSLSNKNNNHNNHNHNDNKQIIIPEISTQVGSARAIIQDFKVRIQFDSISTGRVTIITKADPRIQVPQKLINFFVRNLAGILLHTMTDRCGKIPVNETDGMKDPYYVRMHDTDAWFYHEWLRPKLYNYFKSKGFEFDDDYYIFDALRRENKNKMTPWLENDNMNSSGYYMYNTDSKYNNTYDYNAYLLKSNQRIRTQSSMIMYTKWILILIVLLAMYISYMYNI